MYKMIYGKSKQRGYAAVLLIVLIGVMGLSTVTMYNSGQLTTSKMRQQNAADAAAYSVANIISRDLNFVAYTNRAMVANQAAVGQMVGLASWINYLEQMAINLDTIAGWIPYVGVATELLKQVMEAVATGVNYFAEYSVLGIDYVITGLALAQQGVHVALQFSAVEIYEAVATKNDPDVNIVSGLTAVSLAKSYLSLKSKLHYTDEPERGTSAKATKDLERYDEFAEIVSNSRDQFTERRAWNVRAPIIPWVTRFNANKVGGSDFERVQVNGDKYGWDWSAMDTLGINIEVRSWSVSDGWHWDSIFNMPIGWGAAHALNKDKSGDDYNYFGTGERLYGAEKRCNDGRWSASRDCRWGRSSWSNDIAATLAGALDRGNLVQNISTLRKFYTIKERGEDFVGPQVTVLLEKPLRGANDNVRLWGQVLEDNNKSAQERFDVEADSSTDTMYAFSKSETYFMRPVDSRASAFWRRDEKIEYGNLYNPYWQPRLVDPGA